MKNFITVVGARPQFVKAAALSNAIKMSYRNSLSEKIIHTGQHYDFKMNENCYRKTNWQGQLSATGTTLFLDKR